MKDYEQKILNPELRDLCGKGALCDVIFVCRSVHACLIDCMLHYVASYLIQSSLSFLLVTPFLRDIIEIALLAVFFPLSRNILEIACNTVFLSQGR